MISIITMMAPSPAPTAAPIIVEVEEDDEELIERVDDDVVVNFEVSDVNITLVDTVSVDGELVVVAVGSGDCVEEIC